MTVQNEQRQEDRTESGNASPDGGDWISKYLDLADKMIRTHMPNPPKEGSGN